MLIIARFELYKQRVTDNFNYVEDKISIKIVTESI